MSVFAAAFAVVLGPELPVTKTTYGVSTQFALPAVAGNERGSLVAWLASGRIQARLLGIDGTPARPLPFDFGAAMSVPSVASNNDGFLVAWASERAAVMVRAVTSEGFVGGAVALPLVGAPKIAWNGSEFVVLATDRNTISGVFLSASGAILQGPFIVGEGNIAAAASATGRTLIAYNAGGGKLLARFIDPGAVVSESFTVDEPVYDVSIASDGANFLLAYVMSAGELRATAVSSGGSVETRFTIGPADRSTPSAAWNGHHFVIGFFRTNWMAVETTLTGVASDPHVFSDAAKSLAVMAPTLTAYLTRSRGLVAKPLDSDTPPIPLFTFVADQRDPRIVTNGSREFVMFAEGTDVKLSILDNRGEMLTPDPPPLNTVPVLSFTADRFAIAPFANGVAVAWWEPTELVVRVLSRDGVPVRSDLRLPALGFHGAALAWSGGQLLIAWARNLTDHDLAIDVARVAEDGTVLDAQPIHIGLTSDASPFEFPQIVWGGDRHIVTWQEAQRYTVLRHIAAVFPNGQWRPGTTVGYGTTVDPRSIAPFGSKALVVDDVPYSGVRVSLLDESGMIARTLIPRAGTRSGVQLVAGSVIWGEGNAVMAAAIGPDFAVGTPTELFRLPSNVPMTFSDDFHWIAYARNGAFDLPAHRIAIRRISPIERRRAVR